MIDFDKKFSKLFSGKPRTEDNQDGVSHEEFLEYVSFLTSPALHFRTQPRFCRAFQTFGLFTSGIGVHYQPSAITHAQHQDLASALVIGERMVPHVFVRAADARPYDIQDVLPADARFKVLVFTGVITDPAQAARVRALADEMDAPGSFYHQFGHGNPARVFDVLSVSAAKKEDVNYTGGSSLSGASASADACFNRRPAEVLQAALVEVSKPLSTICADTDGCFIECSWTTPTCTRA